MLRARIEMTDLYVLVTTFLIKEPCLFHFLALLPNTESETK